MSERDAALTAIPLTANKPAASNDHSFSSGGHFLGPDSVFWAEKSTTVFAAVVTRLVPGFSPYFDRFRAVLRCVPACF